MDFEQLRQFDEIVRKGTISSAAKSLHITQPALSRSIQRLETDLGHQLLSRSKNHVEPNDAGMAVVDFARAMLREEQHLRDQLDKLSLRDRTLHIGSVAPAPVWRLTALTVESYPGTVLQPLAREERCLADDLQNRAIDLAISLEPLSLTGCESLPFMHEELYAYVPFDHPLAHSGPVSFARFDGETFLVDASAGFWIDRVRRLAPHATMVEQADRTILTQMVESTKLLTFTTNEAIWYMSASNRVIVPLDDECLKVTFYLNALDDAPEKAHQIMECVRLQTAHETPLPRSSASHTSVT